ncbi:hypothetical protein BRADI_2g01473v3 [Brachypodium distachyon]|uniref:Uncharacterized protein n=1 Tax=Brachypodium distachyon TaxID=15368 RepID=A0A2K2D6F0_BRADI|nr:hypothetical protein BRADI_2g01473v3 [Brachypodium distachyon]
MLAREPNRPFPLPSASVRLHRSVPRRRFPPPPAMAAPPRPPHATESLPKPMPGLNRGWRRRNLAPAAASRHHQFRPGHPRFGQRRRRGAPSWPPRRLQDAPAAFRGPATPFPLRFGGLPTRILPGSARTSSPCAPQLRPPPNLSGASRDPDPFLHGCARSQPKSPSKNLAAA